MGIGELSILDQWSRKAHARASPSFGCDKLDALRPQRVLKPPKRLSGAPEAPLRDFDTLDRGATHLSQVGKLSLTYAEQGASSANLCGKQHPRVPQ